MFPPEFSPGFPPGSLPTRIQGLGEQTPWSGPLREAAVVMLFTPPAAGETDARLVLIRRSSKVRAHRGQIGFAGGRRDPEDATPVITALRELEEELGVDRSRVHVVGTLPGIPDLYGTPIVPVVACTRVLPEDLTPAPAEVDAVFAESWRRFGAGRGREFRFNIFGVWRASRVYEGGAVAVWGQTAHILHAAALDG